MTPFSFVKVFGTHKKQHNELYRFKRECNCNRAREKTIFISHQPPQQEYQLVYMSESLMIVNPLLTRDFYFFSCYPPRPR